MRRQHSNCVNRSRNLWLLVWLICATPDLVADPALVVAGEQLYREGQSTDGSTITALVQGDVPVSGAQLSCRSCHGISGMGTIEGGQIPAAIAGPLLFAVEPQRQRPAYTHATLARALRTGVDAAGRMLDPLMPRYPLSDPDVAALGAYLRELSAEPSPGVTSDVVKIATLIGPDVSDDVEQAVVAVFEKYVADRNRMAHQRLRGGRFPKQWKEVLRTWELSIWRPKGPSDTWLDQLLAFQQQNPVFAMVGGVSEQPWLPVHNFCESERMPCLLPNVKVPPDPIVGDYSVYFSPGLVLEADLLAAAIQRKLTDKVLVVVASKTTPQSSFAGEKLALALQQYGGNTNILDLNKLDSNQQFIQALATKPDAIVLLADLETLRPWTDALTETNAAAPLFFSSTLLNAPWDAIPKSWNSHGTMAHLTTIPGESDSALTRFRIWARKLPIEQEQHQALAYFSLLAFTENYKHMQQFLFRDYFLDKFEHSSSLTSYLPLYTRGSITPGQRVLSLGGYLVDLSGQRPPQWLVP